MKKHMISYTIIISAYKTDPSNFNDLINSINKNDYKNFNIIFLDDGSGDELYKQYEQILFKNIKNQEIIMMKNDQNMGINYSRDLMICSNQERLNDYLVTIDSDDMISNHFFSKINEIVSTNDYPDVINFTSAKLLHQDKNTFATRNVSFLPNVNYIFNLFYKFDINIFKESEFIKFSKSNDDIDISNFSFFAMCLLTQISGPWNLVYKKDFYLKNNLKFLIPSLNINDPICRNVDFAPCYSLINCEFDCVFVKTEDYYYREGSQSSVTKTFRNKSNNINQYCFDMIKYNQNFNKNNKYIDNLFLYKHLYSCESKRSNIFKKEFFKGKYINKINLTRNEKFFINITRSKMLIFFFKLFSKILRIN
ncbi:MAG: glycosyltransferase [Mycoplasma sp.]